MSDFGRGGQTAANWPAPGSAVATAMLHEAESWVGAQGELFSAIEAIWADWMKRQSAALDANSRSLQQMFECRNPADLMQLQQQWVAEAVRRIASDIGSLASDTLAMTRRVGGARPGPGERSQMPRHSVEPARADEAIAPQRAAAE